MTTCLWRLVACIAIVVCVQPAAAQPLTTAFTYQGRLSDGGVAPSGLYDLRFRLFTSDVRGFQNGPQLCMNNVTVNDGLFTVELDFGPVFTGNQLFLEIDVRADAGLSCSADKFFTTLSPRQALTATPNAIYASAVGSLEFSHAADAIDQSQTQGSLVFTLPVGGEAVQTFVPAVTGELSAVDLMFGSNQSGQMSVRILDGPNVVGFGTASVQQILSANFTSVPLSVRPVVNAGQSYSISLQIAQGPATLVSLLKSSVDNPYPPGTLEVNNVVQTQDLAFRTHIGSPGVLSASTPIGIGTPRPAAMLHVDSSFLSPVGATGGGLVLLGNPLSRSLAMDTSTIQSTNALGSSLLKLNPFGGQAMVGTSSPPSLFSAPLGAMGAVTTLGGGGAIQTFAKFSTSSLVLDDASVQARSTLSAAALPLLLNPLGGGVAIGATDPTARLDVSGDIRSFGPASGFLAANPNNASAIMRLDWDTDIPRIRVGGSGVGSANGFDVQTNSNISRLRVLANGNVGLSNPLPTARLDIGGLAGVDGVRFPDATLQTTAYRRLKTNTVFSAAIMNADTTASVIVTVTGAASGDCAIANPRTSLPSGVVLSQVLVGTNTVSFLLRNTGSVAVNVPTTTFDIVVLK